LLRLMNEKGLSRQKLSMLSGVSRQGISFIIDGIHSGKNYETMSKLAPHLGVTPEYLISGEDPVRNIRMAGSDALKHLDALDVVKIPLLGEIPAGYPLPEVNQVRDDFVYVVRDWLIGVKGVEKLYSLRVRGSSLEGDGVLEGDYAIVSPNFEFVNGKIYIVRIGSETVARHVYKENGIARLESSNGNYKTMTESELEILGKVIITIKPPLIH